MSYVFRYINRQVFKSSVSYTLLIENNEEEHRVEKSFKVDANQIDEEFLRTEAKVEIEKIKAGLYNYSEVVEE